MRISGKTSVCGIIANPVEHSMSPVLHNYYAERTGKDMVYVPFKVPEESVEQAIAGAYAMNIQGMSVTVPHKQSVISYLADIDADAKAIGAVNTLVRMDGGYKGYNTDAAGLLRAMKEDGIVISNRPCILLGAGGAAKAAAYILAKEGAEEIVILNRNVSRAKELAEDINRLMGRSLTTARAISDWEALPKKKYLVVQTTSVGMHPNTEQAPIEDAAFYELAEAAVDVIYTPMETKFMSLAKAAGAKVMGGLNMLVYQGVIAYELWNPEVTVRAEDMDGARNLVLEFLGSRK